MDIDHTQSGEGTAGASAGEMSAREVHENLGSLQKSSNALQMLQNQQFTQQFNQLLMQQQLFRRQQLMQQQQAMNSLQQLMQQNDLTNLQHNSLSGLSTISNSQQHMINMVQPGSSLDFGQGNSLNPRQQEATGSLQLYPVYSSQVNISSLSSQSETNPVQANLGSLQQNSSVLQQMLLTQQLKQRYHQLQMQQQLFQPQQLVPVQQALQQQTALLRNPQTSQLYQMRQQMGMKTGVLQQQLLMQQQFQQALLHQMGMKTGVLQQQQSVGQRVGSHHSQLKSGISSPQLHQALSPQRKEKGKVEGDVTLQMEFEPYASTVEVQMGNANGADWQEEVYQKIKSMREMYLSEINDLYQKIASAVQQRPQHEKIEKLKSFKMMLERIVLFLWLNKHEIQLSHKEKLFAVEKHISFFLSYKQPHKRTSSPLQGQLPQPSMHTSQAQNTYAHQTPMMDSDVQDIASEFDRLLSLID